jgi:N-acylneuraminate cytidylyltransferase
MDEIAAIIPARSGSKSIKDKNLIQIDGYPLLAYSIAIAKMSPSIGRVIVSTDSPTYARIAEKYGAEVPFIRPKKLSLDSSTDYDFMDHLINWFDENSKSKPEYWVHLRPTTPLREINVVEEAISLFKKRHDASSLRSGHISPESPFKWLRKNKEGYLTNLIGNNTNLDSYNGPRQDFPDVYIPNGYVDIVRSSFIRNKKILHGNRVLAFETPICNEVDSIEEMDLIEYQLQKKGSQLTEYLEDIV